MDWRLWFRFGLPLGHALLLVAVLDLAILCMWFLKDLGMVFFWPYVLDKDGMKFNTNEIIFATAFILFKLFSTLLLLWFGTIFRGNTRMLFGWIICMLLSIIVLLFEICLFVFPSYTHEFLSYIVTALTLLVTFCYQVIVGFEAYKALKHKDYDTLKPVGKGPKYIWDYLNNERREAAVFCLVLELVIDGYFLISRDVHNGILGMNMAGDLDEEYPPIIVEQLIMKAIRLVVNSIGLTLVLRGRIEKFRIWCALSFFLVLISTSIFVILTLYWRGDDMFMLVAYFVSYPGHLLFRCVVLYFCLRFTRIDLTSMVL